MRSLLAVGTGSIAPRRGVRLTVAALTAIVAWAVAPSLASADSFSWSAPIGLDRSGSSQNLEGVSCPSTTQCTAVDAVGQEVTFNPTSPGTPTTVTVDSGQQLRAVACPTTSQF